MTFQFLDHKRRIPPVSSNQYMAANNKPHLKVPHFALAHYSNDTNQTQNPTHVRTHTNRIYLPTVTSKDDWWKRQWHVCNSFFSSFDPVLCYGCWCQANRNEPRRPWQAVSRQAKQSGSHKPNISECSELNWLSRLGRKVINLFTLGTRIHIGCKRRRLAGVVAPGTFTEGLRVERINSFRYFMLQGCEVG